MVVLHHGTSAKKRLIRLRDALWRRNSESSFEVVERSKNKSSKLPPSIASTTTASPSSAPERRTVSFNLEKNVIVMDPHGYRSEEEARLCFTHYAEFEKFLKDSILCVHCFRRTIHSGKEWSDDELSSIRGLEEFIVDNKQLHARISQRIAVLRLQEELREKGYKCNDEQYQELLRKTSVKYSKSSVNRALYHAKEEDTRHYFHCSAPSPSFIGRLRRQSIGSTQN